MEPEDQKDPTGPVDITLNSVSVIADSVEPDPEISEEV